MALLLPHSETLTGAALLTVTLAALILMDFTLDHPSTAEDAES